MGDAVGHGEGSRLLGGYERHLHDAYVVVGGLALAAGLSVFRFEHISTGERAVSQWVNHLPDWLNAPLETVMMVGMVGTLFAVIALAFRRGWTGPPSPERHLTTRSSLPLGRS